MTRHNLRDILEVTNHTFLNVRAPSTGRVYSCSLNMSALRVTFLAPKPFGNSIDTLELKISLLRCITTPAAGFEPAVPHVGEGEWLAAQGADAVRGGGRLLRFRALQDAAPAHAQDGVHHDAAPLPHAPGVRDDRERGRTHHVRVEGACRNFDGLEPPLLECVLRYHAELHT